MLIVFTIKFNIRRFKENSSRKNKTELIVDIIIVVIFIVKGVMFCQHL